MSPATSSATPIDKGRDNEIRVMLATDIHLGYGEKHTHKANDSFVTFEEILILARDKEVDFLLLGGDLFHENKPTRDAQMKCCNLLRKYAMGDAEVALEYLSDPAKDFEHCDRRDVNYMDPNLNVALPIFSIHGNHDDPSGLGGHSCMDLMHSTGLLNYFGKAKHTEEVIVQPVLLKRGHTRLALYGLSSMKDEKLHRLFRANRVTMLRPEENTEEWFNVLVMHQNRSKHGQTNYIPDHFVDGFVDLVFWGHEHECRVEPEMVNHGEGKQFFITQPGSSVATALTEGESQQKCIGLLTVRGKEFKIDAVPLQTVRPMIFKTISLDSCDDLPTSDGGSMLKDEKKIQAHVEAYLKGVVEEMLLEVDGKLTGHPMQPTLPQLRLRVDYSDEAHQIAPGRFGNNFHDRVANPSEILLFRKRAPGMKDDKDGGFEPHHMDRVGEAKGSSMEELIVQYFRTTEDDKAQLKLLGVKGIAQAVSNFIEKDDKDAIAIIVDKQLGKTKQELLQRQEADADDDAIDEALSKYK